jgi:hypothetical protein
MVTRTPPKLIGLCAPAMGSGKTEVANRMSWRYTLKGPKPADHSGLTFHPVKFAAPLKAMADVLLGMAGVPFLTRERMLEGDLKETPIDSLGNVTPRRLLQTLGTEWGRKEMGKDFWVNPTMFQVDALLERGNSVVIDDLRFANEADAITSRGGILIRVVRPDAKPYAAHASEGELDGWAMPEIHNTGTLEDLYKQADKLARGESF